LAAVARRTRLHGMSRDSWRRHLPGEDWRYSVEELGLKANMTDLQAAIGRAQLLHLEQWQKRREQIVRRYDRNLSSIRGLRVPAWPEQGRHAWHLYIVRVTPDFGAGRDDVVARLSERGIGTSVHFIPVHQMPFYTRLIGSYAAAALPIADAVFEEIISLPLYPSMTNVDVDRVCQEISDLQGGRADLARVSPEPGELA
jgi:dTDP-4-amino-4,6-dideoxygalactose transaminase